MIKMHSFYVDIISVHVTGIALIIQGGPKKSKPLLRLVIKSY